MTRSWPASLTAVLVLLSLLVPTPSALAVDGPDAPLVLPAGYADRVNDTLQQGRDRWGEKLIATPDGPSLDNVRPLLVPANKGNDFLTDSGWVYLPLTYPRPDPAQWVAQRAFALHVTDGSQIISDWAERDLHQARRHATFAVGQGSETYGSNLTKLGQPKLGAGYLPVLANSYLDQQGVRWDRESFVYRLSGRLVSLVKFTAYGDVPTRLAVRLTGAGVTDAVAQGNQIVDSGQTYLAWSGSGASWSAGTLSIPVKASKDGAEVYLMVPNVPADLGTVHIGKADFDNASSTVAKYWREQLAAGAKVELPDKYAENAMRNLLIQNLVMGWQQSIGNGYEFRTDNEAFVLEVSASVQALGDFGFSADYTANLMQILRRGQGSFFPSWEYGTKMQSAAASYLLTGDSAFLRSNLAVFTGYLDELARQRDADPNGLLAKVRAGGDLPGEVYAVHGQADAWRGLRDMGVALRRLGEHELAGRFSAEAAGLEQALRRAIAQSQTWLPDGSLFVPIPLLDPAAPKPYEHVTDSTSGGYWNLLIGYFLGTGFFAPDSAEARGMAKYLYTRGALFLGLTRFNLTGIEPGKCETGGTFFGTNPPGYKASGVDEQYGYGRVKFLSQLGEADRIVLNFYGKLAHDLTPNTFIGGEGVTLAPCPQLGEYYRTQFRPPLSANNATYLQELRSMLIREDLAADGTPDKLWLTPATPRTWLSSGKRIAATGMPTRFGPVTFAVESHLSQDYIEARVQPPARTAGRVNASSVMLTLRAPADHRLESVTVNGKPAAFHGETVDLGPIGSAVTVRATYTDAPVPSYDQAEPTVVNPPRRLFNPGEAVDLDVTVESIGAGTVTGKLVASGSGWTLPAPRSFRVRSSGKLSWQQLKVPVKVPDSPGRHTLSLTALPDRGTATTRTVTVDVTESLLATATAGSALGTPGVARPMTVDLTSQTDAPLTGTVRAELPAGWQVPPAQSFTLPAGGSQRLTFDVATPAGTAPGAYPVRFIAQAASGRSVAAVATMHVVDPTSYPGQVSAQRPVGYWRLGEASGTRGDDYSGNANHGTYADGVTLGHPGAISGDPDTATGLSDGYLNVADSETVSLTGPFTIEAWVNVTNTSQQYSIVEKYDAPAPNGYALRVLPGGRLAAYTLGAPGSIGSVEGRTALTPGNWHHVAAVYDGSTITVYLDGVADGSAPTTIDPTDGTSTLKLGARGDDAGTRLSGDLDEVAIYAHALSAEQIAAHHRSGSTP